ncbi:BRCA1-associated ATM activator 1, partial [Dissophora globulifera]
MDPMPHPAASPDAIEALRRVVAALPTMPHTIVDDTRHEKVLSYVAAFIAHGDPRLLRRMLADWAILDTLNACLAPGQDHRVACVALRLLGYLLEHDPAQHDPTSATSVWHLLQTQYPSILDYLIANTMGDEALTRFSCWFALAHLVKYDDGARWLLKTGQCATMVSAALKDTSTYVLTAACQFLVAIIENRSTDALQLTAHDTLLDTLLESISLYKLIHGMMTDHTSERNRVAGLEFLWMVADSKSDRGTAFLRQSQLFFPYMDVLMDDSRLVRSRALDVLSTLLGSVSNPLSLLGKDSVPSQDMDMDKTKDEAMVECNYLLDHDVCSLLKQTDSLKALHVATGILEAMTKPLHQCDEMLGSGTCFNDTILSTTLWIIQALQETKKADQLAASRLNTSTIVVQGDSILAKQLNQPGFQDLVQHQSRSKPTKGAAARGGTLPKMIVLSALKTLQNLALLFPVAVEKSSAIDVVLTVLFDQKLCSDQRVFKACLTTLPLVLKTKVQDGHLLDQQLFATAMEVILGILHRPALGSTSLGLLLTAVKEFFSDDALGKILSQEKVGADLVNGLGLKLYDVEWDVRDNVVEFIGTLFAPGGPDHGVAWALKHDVLESVFQKLSDEEAYVRAASVHTFETVMRDARGWKAMCAQNLDERLSGQLPSLIRDSEAFVRRAVLEAMVCLVSERESGTVLMVNGTDLFVDAQFMSRLTLDDSDWEVRIRACEFIAAVWEHCLALDERADYRIRASKRLKDSDDTVIEGGSGDRRAPKPSSWWFYDIKGDQILVQATQDASRLVRLTSVEILKKIKASLEQRMDTPSPSDLPVNDNYNNNGDESREKKSNGSRSGKRP